MVNGSSSSTIRIRGLIRAYLPSHAYRHECRRFEVPTPPAASPFRNFKSKAALETYWLPVPLLLAEFASEGAAIYHEVCKRGTGAMFVVSPFGRSSTSARPSTM